MRQCGAAACSGGGGEQASGTAPEGGAGRGGARGARARSVGERGGVIGSPGLGAICRDLRDTRLPAPVIVGAEIHTETKSDEARRKFSNTSRAHTR